MTKAIRLNDEDIERALLALLALESQPVDAEDRVRFQGQACWNRQRVLHEVREAIEDKFVGLKMLRELEYMGFIKNGITSVRPDPTMPDHRVYVRVVRINTSKVVQQLGIRGFDAKMPERSALEPKPSLLLACPRCSKITDVTEKRVFKCMYCHASLFVD